MDLLGSILNSMDGPPKVDDKQKELIKKQKAAEEKFQNQAKHEIIKFRQYVEDRIGRFAKDDRKFIQFQPMDKLYRAIIHDVCETADLFRMSFGEDGVDRHVMVYKKEHPPSEDEITARRNGEKWSKELALEYAKRRDDKQRADEARAAEDKEAAKEDAEFQPKIDYRAKYAHLIGEDVALEAAKKTETNKSYGNVPSANKRDIRTIEQTMADIQAKKRLKLSKDCDEAEATSGEQ